MKVAFILIVYMSSTYTGGPLMIDNLESREACELLKTQITERWPRLSSGECFPVKRPAEPDGGAV